MRISDFNEEQSINEVNDDDRGSYEPPDRNSHDYRSRLRSPEHSTSQCLEVKLFLDKIPYFDRSNNKEALNFLAQCEEAMEKMKASEVTIAWSKLAG